MKSLFAKILLWFWFTLAITVVGSAFISALNVSENASDERAPVARLVRFQLEEARSAYEIGGRPGLQAFLDTLRRIYDARGILTDETGRDLLTNQDRSDLVRRARRPSLYQLFRTGDATVSRAADDGRYWFFYIVPRVRVGSWFLLPEHAFVMAAGVLLCYWLALYLTSPVRKLEKAVERFGRGDLSARVGSNRRDELVQQLVDDSSIEAAAHGCELKYEKREAVTVAGDPELLRRAVENVIRNAIRYAPRETAVEVSLARNHGKAVVGVRDQGSGVPEEALPRLFGAFYRVEGDRDRASGGTGLGLSIARRAIELHRGSIRARNARPGLEVEMELPVA